MSTKQMTQTSRMIHKANQIASFFEAYETEKAIEGVADHIKKFWTPAMRDQLQSYIQDNGEDLHELVIQAAERI
mgnify:CR=1 FL=1